MTQAQPPAPGVYTPSPTFFKAGGKIGREEVDVEEQVKHTVFLAQNGITGVVLLGSTGEMIHMTRKERIDFVAGVKKGLVAAGHGSFPVLAGVAQNSVQETLEDVEGMKQAGAEFAMVLAPNYFAPSTSQQGLISWFTAVADESVLPVVIYYYPGVSNGLKITAETFEVLAAHANIVGVKMSHGDVSQYIQVALNPKVQKESFSAITGLGQLLLPALVAGCDGTIDAMSGIFPKTVVKIYELGKQGKFKEAQKLQYTLSRVEEVVVAYGPVGIKYTAKKVHNFGAKDIGRAPLDQQLGEDKVGRFDADIAAAWALEQSL